MFEQIIQYFIDKNELHERAALEARTFAAYLEDQSEYTTERLKDVIQKFNFETVKPRGFDNENYYPHLEFWRGVGDFSSDVAFGYDGDIEFECDTEPIVKEQYKNELILTNAEKIAAAKAKNSVKIDVNKYPISLLGYYEYKFCKTTLFYTWLAYLWQEVAGHQCGLKVMTIENNSIERFSLNDFLRDDFSAYMTYDYGAKPPKVDNFFPRKLSIPELFMRASQTGYPFNPYKNYWRYFEKGNDFKEIVTYECVTGIRSGKLSERMTAEVKQIKQHECSKAALMYLTDFTNQAIFNDWQEKFRPIGMPEQMHDKAYDFEFWTGVSYYTRNEEKNRLKEEDILNFEVSLGIKLPTAYFQYLRLFNGRQYNNHLLFFPINDLYTIKIQKFYTLKELNETALITLSQNLNYLWIGDLEEVGHIGICIEKESKHFGKIVIGKEEDIQIYEYHFEKFARFAQSSPVKPEIFAAQENDTVFLKKWLDDGWDINTKSMYAEAIGHAAAYNAHEALEMLLNYGARLIHKNHRVMSWVYDERTLDLLDKYP